MLVSPYHRSVLFDIHEKFGEGWFHWKEVKDIMPEGVAMTFYTSRNLIFKEMDPNSKRNMRVHRYKISQRGMNSVIHEMTGVNPNRYNLETGKRK